MSDTDRTDAAESSMLDVMYTSLRRAGAEIVTTPQAQTMTGVSSTTGTTTLVCFDVRTRWGGSRPTDEVWFVIPGARDEPRGCGVMPTTSSLWDRRRSSFPMRPPCWSAPPQDR